MQLPDLKHVPQHILPQLANMKPYLLMLQKKGPNYNNAYAQQIIQAEHLPYLFRLREEGTVLLSIPVMDNTDVTAIAIYSVIDKEEAKRLTEADPGVQKGIFVYELLSCIGMKGDTLN